MCHACIAWPCANVPACQSGKSVSKFNIYIPKCQCSNKRTNVPTWQSEQIQSCLFKNKYCWACSYEWDSTLIKLFTLLTQINRKIFSPSLLDALNGLPERISDENITLLVDSFSKRRIFVWISKYSDVIQARFNLKEPCLSKNGTPNAFVKDQFHNQRIKDSFKIFPSINC